MSTPYACPVCDSQQVTPFFTVKAVPVHVGLQWPDKEAARHCPKGDIALQFCEKCGHIFNSAFDSTLMDYKGDYDNSLDHSPRFREYLSTLASRLIDQYDMRHKEVVEIGCGKGDFLQLLCELGDNRGIGFDPSYQHDSRKGEVADRVTFIRGYYSEQRAHRADLICCRHVFEHLPHPVDFLTMVRRSIEEQQDTVVYFEVPNTASILRDRAIWNVIYEHCSHFTLSSLAHVFSRCGFSVRDLYESYETQFLGIEAVPGNGVVEALQEGWKDVEAVRRYVSAFQENYRQMMRSWRRQLGRIEKAGQQAVLWGAGAKALSFLNLLKVHDLIEYVVDINPKKQGTYMPGTGQQIVAPEFLRDFRPDIVIIMNPIYRDEIRRTLDSLGVAAQVLCAS